MYPKLDINLKKIRENTAKIVSIAQKRNIEIIGVTKGICGDKKIAQQMLQAGVSYLADSRLANFKNLNQLNTKLMYLKVPSLSQANGIVTYADISFNSELKTIKKLNKVAKRKNLIHDIVLMLELGDKREGLKPDQINSTIQQVLTLENINLVGIATNFCCLNHISPDEKEIAQFKKIATSIIKKYQLKLEITSAGSSSSLPLLNKNKFAGNQLRVGETILLGREVPTGKQFLNLNLDTFILKAEIVEIKNRRINNRLQQRALLAVGRQDINPTALFPFNKNIKIIDATSDYLILDITDSKDLKLGAKIKFNLGYSSLLRSMTSPHISKNYL